MEGIIPKGTTAPISAFVIKDGERSQLFDDLCTKYFYGIIDIFDIAYGTLVETLEPFDDVPKGTIGTVIYDSKINSMLLRVGNSEHIVYSNIKVRKVNDMKIKVQRKDELKFSDVDFGVLVELQEPLHTKCGCLLVRSGAIGYKTYLQAKSYFVVIANDTLGTYFVLSDPTVKLVKLPITLEKA